MWTGDYPSRDACLAGARNEFGDDPFWICSGEQPNARDLIPGAEWVMAELGQNASDHGQPDGVDNPEASEEAEAELDALLKAWADKHVSLNFWVSSGTPERIEGGG
jgi:hypothetical protein